MADTQAQLASQQIRRPKLRRKGTNKFISAAVDSDLPPDTIHKSEAMKQTDDSISLQIETTPYTSKFTANSSLSGTTIPNRARNKKSHPHLQYKANPQDNQQQNHSNPRQQSPPKQASPKNLRTHSKNYNIERSPHPPASQPATTINGSNIQKRRGRRNKQQSAQTDSAPDDNSGSSGEETSPVITPRHKLQHLRAESAPEPSMERRSSSPEIPLSPQPTHSPQKPIFYAGAGFEKSPAPSALPIPSFTSRQTPLSSSLPIQPHIRVATTDNRPVIPNEHRIHPSISAPLLQVSVDPTYIHQNIYSTPIANRSITPRYSPTLPAQNVGYDNSPVMFAMDEEQSNQAKELRKKSRDLLTLLGAARDEPDIYAHGNKMQMNPVQEWADNTFVLEQIGRNLKNLLKIQS